MAKIVRWDNGQIIYKDNSPFIEETIQNALLEKINLSYANLRGVNFYKKWDLNNINFSNADFKNARVYRADFSGAILNNVKNLNTNCPKEGEFIGYKKMLCWKSSKYKKMYCKT